MQEVKIIRSNRRSLSISISKDGEIVVRAPRFCTKKTIQNFLTSKSTWIEKTLKKVSESVDLQLIPFEISKQDFHSQMIVRCDYWASIIGVKYNKLTIKNLKSRWGSCNSNSEIVLNYQLSKVSNQIKDYIIIHELCHIIHMNHSKDFKNLVNKYCPNSKEIIKKIKMLKIK